MDGPKRIEFLARGLWIQGQSVLVCRNIGHGHCYLPGGHVEPGESASDAVAREFREETGEHVRVGPARVVMEHLFEQRGKPRHEVSIVFHVERAAVGPGQVMSVEPEIAFEWVPASELAKAGFVPSALIPIIQRAIEAGSGGPGASPVDSGGAVHFLSSQ